MARAKPPKQYHLEYGYSCMGYEIPAAMGAKLAAPDSEVVAIVGDGTYQMLPQEIATIVSENLKVIIVLLQNHGFASIGGLSESRGSQRFGTNYRMRGNDSDRLDGGYVPSTWPAAPVASVPTSWRSTPSRSSATPTRWLRRPPARR